MPLLNRYYKTKIGSVLRTILNLTLGSKIHSLGTLAYIINCGKHCNWHHFRAQNVSNRNHITLMSPAPQTYTLSSVCLWRQHDNAARKPLCIADRPVLVKHTHDPPPTRAPSVRRTQAVSALRPRRSIRGHDMPRAYSWGYSTSAAGSRGGVWQRG